MKIIAEFKTPKAPATAAGRIILVERTAGPGHHPFVTWWENMETGGRIWGHYFKTLAEAKVDYLARVDRGY